MTVSEGGVFLRPWHLNFRPDAGFRGYADPVLIQGSSFNCFLKFTFGCQPLRIMSSSLQRWSLELGSNLKTCEFSQASSIMLQR